MAMFNGLYLEDDQMEYIESQLKHIKNLTGNPKAFEYIEGRVMINGFYYDSINCYSRLEDIIDAYVFGLEYGMEMAKEETK